MKRRIVSVVIALAMVFSMAAVSFADTAKAKVTLDVTSGGTDISVVAYDNYVVKATIDGDGTVNKNEVTATLTMTDVAGLGIEGTRSETFTLTTGLGDSVTSIANYVGALTEFDGVRVEATVNGKAFAYDVTGSYDAGEWVATPDSADAVRSAWQELTAHVVTNTGADDSNIAIKKGTTITVGKEVLTFVKDLTVQDLNAQGDDMTGQVLDAVAFSEDGDGSYTIYLPEGSALQVGASSATLAVGAKIKFGGVDLSNISFKEIKQYANDGDAEAMVIEALSLLNGGIAAVNETETVTVDITTDCYKNDAVECPCDNDCCEGCDPVEEPTVPPTDPTNPTNPTNPTEPGKQPVQTDDTTPVGVMGALALAAVVAMAGVVLTRKRATSKQID